jgi:glucose-1-phosphate thymidylyltransferase
VKVIIPLAGKGTRLRPHTFTTPKPLLRVGGKPVMSYIMDDLRKLGVSEAVFITGYLKDVIETFVRTEYPDFTSHFVEQPVQDGTAGAVKLAEPFIDQDVLIIFVDTLFDADLNLVKTLPPDVAGVIWAKEVEDYQRFGVIVTDDNGFMKRIVEKPRDPVSKLANIGLYYIKDWKLLFDGIRSVTGGPKAKGGEFYLTDAFQFMVDQGAKIKVVEVEGWFDCGQVETLLDTNRHLLETTRARHPDGGVRVKVHDPVRIEEGVQLENVEIGPNVTIETGCVIKNSKLRDSLVGGGTTLENCDLHESIIGSNVKLVGVNGKVSIGESGEVVSNGSTN